MTFLFRTVRLGSERQPDEGLRIGTVRRPPRGVPKDEFASRNFYDVWLPILAPSKELLESFHTNAISDAAFFRRYRREMQKTDARQVIMTLAVLARTTPFSVGCYCENRKLCHRSVLGDLIREAAGLNATRPLADRAVYTIKAPEELQVVAREGGGAGTFEENKPWTTATTWLNETQSSGEKLPILFADATDCSRLTHWATLDFIEVDRTHNTTQYAFSGLRQLRPIRSPQELALFNTNEPIAEGYIRPYALVKTPPFLRDSRAGRSR